MTEDKKTVAIIGGAGLLGSTFVKKCKDENMSVCVLDLCDENIWEKRNIICDLFLKTDINSSKSLNNAIKHMFDQVDNIDCVVNASYPRNKFYGKSFLDVNLEDFNEHIKLHIGGYFNVMQSFSKLFLEQGHGNIINISSIQGVMSPKFEHYENTDMVSPIEYTAAKSAIISMSKYLAKFMAKKNIRVNCISPGGILDNQPEIFLKHYKESCSSKGMLDADDLSGVVLFLISDQSKYLNGQNIIVDDGFSL